MSVVTDLSDDVALVTGGGGGIGAGVAALLAEAGARVAVLDVSGVAAKTVAERISSDGGTAIAAEADVTDEVGLGRALAVVREQFGPVSVLVNSATAWTVGTFADTAAQDVRRVVDVTLIGAVNTMRAVLPDLLTTQGRIVNVASDSARTGTRSMGVYAGAGAAVIAVTRSVAKEVAGRGVRANVVAPGTTVTPGNADVIETLNGADQLVRGYPLGRLGTPADIAWAVLFLVSPMSTWITGQVLPVNGGHTMI
jgi:NAD(P)-dependent dehydrogenase (short-subunit alcohol dehydrogenase family)